MKINERLISHNFTRGRFGYKIKRVILHTYAGGGTSLYNWFNRPTTQASAHYAVMFDGLIERYVRDEDMAWHAGTTAGGGLPNNNWESIGIEHQDNGNWQDGNRTNEMYEASAQLVAELCRKHNISCRLLSKNDKWGSGIALHNYYANKACPGGLNAQRIVNRANEILNPPKPVEPDWKKGWTKKEESIEPVKEYHLYNIVDGSKVKTYKPEGKKVGTSYQKQGWRMTQYSWDKNIPNAFKISELIWRPEPEPTPIPVEPKITKLWEVRISHDINVDDAFTNINESEIFQGDIGSFDVAKKSYELALDVAKENTNEQERDLLVFTVERTFEDGKQKEVKMINSEVIEYEESIIAKEYMLVYLPFRGEEQSMMFWELDKAQKEYYKVQEQLNQGDELKLFENGILINSYKKPMERPSDQHKTIGDHLRSTTQIAVPVQGVTTFVGVIFAYYNPDMPMEVVLAFTGLFGVAFNVLYIVASKLLAKLD